MGNCWGGQGGCGLSHLPKNVKEDDDISRLGSGSHELDTVADLSLQAGRQELSKSARRGGGGARVSA